MNFIRNIRIPASLKKINWSLLLFLVLALNVKMIVKVAVLLVLIIVNRKMFHDKQLYRQQFIWFYVAMIAIGLVNAVLMISSFSVPYLLTLVIGITFWLMCVAAAFLNYWFVKQTPLENLHATVQLFFLLNSAFTFIQLLLIIMDAGAINPFTYQGMNQKYFIGTGDYMTGLPLDVSTTNALLNAFGFLYFLYRQKISMTLLCLAVLLLTASNLTNLILALVMVFVFIFRSNRNQKSVIVFSLLLMIVFMARISPENNAYMTDAFNKFVNKQKPNKVIAHHLVPLIQRPDSILNEKERKQKIAMLYLDSLNRERWKRILALKLEVVPDSKPLIPAPNLHTKQYQRLKDSANSQKELLTFMRRNLTTADTLPIQTGNLKLPGKALAIQQTLTFMKNHPARILTGTGIGNFASKLAFRATGLRVAGGFPKNYSYVNDDFLHNHLLLYLHYFSMDIELHSQINSPNSGYDQLFSEYGLAGVFAFILLYLRFFVKKGRFGYGIPLLLILLGAFIMDYWYEQLSIVILFELLMLINMKATKPQT